MFTIVIWEPQRPCPLTFHHSFTDHLMHVTHQTEKCFINLGSFTLNDCFFTMSGFKQFSFCQETIGKCSNKLAIWLSDISDRRSLPVYHKCFFYLSTCRQRFVHVRLTWKCTLRAKNRAFVWFESSNWISTTVKLVLFVRLFMRPMLLIEIQWRVMPHQYSCRQSASEREENQNNWRTEWV